MDEIDAGDMQPFPTALGIGKVAVAVGGKAIHRPSGDQAGRKSPPSPVVNARAACGWRDRESTDWRNPPRGSRQTPSAFHRAKKPLVFIGGIVGQPFQPVAIGMNTVKIGRTFAFGGEGNPVAFRRPGGVIIEGPGGRQRMLAAAVGLRNIQRRFGGAMRRNRTRSAAWARKWREQAHATGGGNTARFMIGLPVHRAEF